MSAISLTIIVSMTASWLNWGLGLVTPALTAREIAKRIRMDFGWLVAAAYSGANTLGAKLDNAWILNLTLVLFGALAASSS